MTCCSGSCAAAGFFGPKIARWDLRRYQRRGPDRITRLLLEELRRSPLAGLHLLDVGSGIGAIAAELASDGLAGATLADASPAYLDVARHHVGPRYASRPVHFILGDFTVTGAALPDADIVTLDRVVCCYPDADALLRLAAMRSRRLLAFTYPREKWFLRAAFILAELLVSPHAQPLSRFCSLPAAHGLRPGSRRLRPGRAPRNAPLGPRPLPPPLSLVGFCPSVVGAAELSPARKRWYAIAENMRKHHRCDTTPTAQCAFVGAGFSPSRF